MKRTRIACLSVGLAVLAATPALAQGPVELSSSPVPENPGWKNYVLGTGELTAKPVRVNAVSGGVTNADGLVDPAKGPARLTYSGTGPVPTIILDYGREVGGLPFFTASSVSPGSVTLRAAYSEAREFLWTPGSSTLALAAPAGATNVKVPSVTNFIAGDTIQVGSATARIARRRDPVTHHDAVRARRGRRHERQGRGHHRPHGRRRAARRRADGHAHDGRHAGPRDDARRGGRRGRDQPQGRERHGPGRQQHAHRRRPDGAGHGGRHAGRERHRADARRPARRGGSQRRRRALRRHRPLLHARADRRPGAPARRVLAPGTGITLDAPLAAAQAAGATVRSTPGAITGDRVGFNGVGMSGSRAENFTISAPGRVGNAANMMQGGQRFQAITLTTPGTLELSAVGIDFRHPNASAADYAGHFLSSDTKLNKLWFQGAYTNDTNSVPIGAVPGQTIPVILDGAKRDRRPWSGDLDLQGRTAYTSLGFGAEGLGLHQGHAAPVRRHAGRRRPHLRPHPELDGVAAERRLLLHELLDVPRAQRRRLLPVLGRHRVRAGADRDHQAPARLQPLARGPAPRPADHQRRRRRPRLGLLRRRQARRGDARTTRSTTRR